MSKRLLLVTYHFPPVLSAGVSRMIGITRSLAARGWEITVVTVGRSCSELSEDATRTDIPETLEVVRTGTLEIDRFNPRILFGIGTGGGNGDPDGVRKLLAGVLKYPYLLLHRLGSYPERQAGWNPPLYGALKRLITPGRFDVVMSSSPPHSSHLPLLALKKRRAFRWVADFRDPWSVPPNYGKLSPALPLTRHVERTVLRACDHVIANTPGNRKALLSAFPALSPETVTVVTNGFDTGEAVEQAGPEDVACDLVYTGELYEGMLDAYIEAVAHLRGSGFEPLPRLFLYGYADERSLRAIVRNGLEDFIIFKGRVSRARSLGIMRAARALLAAVPHNRRGASWVPSKLYAYLFAHRPILLFAPRGDATELLRSSGAGMAVTTRDGAEAAAALGGFIERVRSGAGVFERDDTVIANYTMESIGDRIERILERQAGESE